MAGDSSSAPGQEGGIAIILALFWDPFKTVKEKGPTPRVNPGILLMEGSPIPAAPLGTSGASRNWESGVFPIAELSVW